MLHSGSQKCPAAARHTEHPLTRGSCAMRGPWPAEYTAQGVEVGGPRSLPVTCFGVLVPLVPTDPGSMGLKVLVPEATRREPRHTLKRSCHQPPQAP